MVLHAGSALKKGGDVGKALERAAAVIAEALEESEDCALHLEDTAGRRRDARALLRGARAHDRGRRAAASGSASAWTPATCGASGYDIASAGGPRGRPRRLRPRRRAASGSARCTSTTRRPPLGSNVDRHANLGDGEIGPKGIAAFLSEPRFDGLACIFEGPGKTGKAVEREDVENALALRRRGLKARG